MGDATRISALEQKVQQLAEQNEKLLHRMTDEGGGAGGADAPVELADEVAAMDRRHMLRRLGTAAAATVGLVAANGAVNPARAADGDPLEVGGSHTGDSETQISYDSGDPGVAAFRGSGGSGAGLYGFAGSGVGVRGFASGTGGIAVLARSRFSATTAMHGLLDGSVAGTAVHGEVDNEDEGGTGVLGEATGGSTVFGYGVRGITGDANTQWGAGVRGFAPDGGKGVEGVSSDGFGVIGYANDEGGVGVYAEGGSSVSVRGTGLLAVSHYGPALQLSPSSVAITVPPDSGDWTAGQFLTKDGHVWYCISGGTGTDSEWVRLSSTFVPLATPDRIYDSRSGFDPAGTEKGKIGRGETRDIDAAFTGTIPSSASAILLNATVAATTNSGFVKLYPGGATEPDTASLNYTGAGQIIGNNATVGLSSGELTAKVDGGSSGSSNELHLILDAYGYYA